MKIAYFTSCYPRVTDTFIRREVVGLRARGFEVATYSLREAESSHDVDQEVLAEKQNTRYLFPINFLTLLIDVLYLLAVSPVRFFKAFAMAWKTARPGFKGHLLQMAYFLEAVMLARLLKKDGIEHLHNHFGDSSGNVTLFVSLLLDIPYSISFHGPHVFFDAGQWALGVKVEHASFIACIGHYCRSQLMLHSQQKYWDKLKIVRCGIDPGAFQYREPASEIKKLLYVGRLDAEKGLPILFSCMSILASKGYDLRLTLLGDGKDRQYLESRAVELGISERVDFRGFVGLEEVADTLRDSDLFVLPSFAEGIPVSFMEAMAVGVPVVATNVGGVFELVIDGETGMVVSAADETGLADAIARYVDNPALCREISLRAREKVTGEFNIEDQIDKLASHFGAR